MYIDNLSNFIADRIIDSVSKVALEHFHHPNNNSDILITKTAKNAMNKRDKLFQKWVSKTTNENDYIEATQSCYSDHL